MHVTAEFDEMVRERCPEVAKLVDARYTAEHQAEEAEEVLRAPPDIWILVIKTQSRFRRWTPLSAETGITSNDIKAVIGDRTKGWTFHNLVFSTSASLLVTPALSL